MPKIPARWRSLAEYFGILLSPLTTAGTGGWFLVEAAGPDGDNWTSLDPVAVPLEAEDPALAATRAVARLCGATRSRPDPRPSDQQRRGIYYVPASLTAPRRSDRQVTALGAVVLDIDDRDHGGRQRSLASLARAPRPTAVIHSGGGIQAAYVLREAVTFDRSDEGALAESVRAYLRVALALQTITDADNTAWPAHLFRCPQTYHLKVPERPVLVTVEVDESRRFNLSDLDDLAPACEAARVDMATARLTARLLGRAPPRQAAPPIPPLAESAGSSIGRPRVVLPRRVSPHIVRLLNEGRHPKYKRRDGSLDRSRAVYAAILSLLGAGLTEARVASILGASALRSAVYDRGDDAERWLAHQIAAARKFLETSDGKRRSA